MTEPTTPDEHAPVLMSDADLDRHISDLADRLIKLAGDIATGPRDESQLIALDDIADALTIAFRLEQECKQGGA